MGELARTIEGKLMIEQALAGDVPRNGRMAQGGAVAERQPGREPARLAALARACHRAPVPGGRAVALGLGARAARPTGDDALGRGADAARARRQGRSPDLSSSQLDARDRFAAAVDSAGPGLADIVWRIVCAGEGMRQAESALGWPARAGKLVLGIALDRIADYYRIR